LIDELVRPDVRTKLGGPNRAVAEFLARRPERFRIDAELCDFYGRNVTWSPNGWLRRI
jgi:cephalosporin hydroxylase